MAIDIEKATYGGTALRLRLAPAAQVSASPLTFWLRRRLAKAKKNPVERPDFLKTGGASMLKTNCS